MKLNQLLKQAQAGDGTAAFYVGYLYETGQHAEIAKNEEEAIHWYRSSANRGMAAAHYNLARIFLSEKRKEDLRALFHLEAAAELGSLEAAHLAGRIYEVGKPAFQVEKNFNKAFDYYRLGAQQGHTKCLKAAERIAIQLNCDLHILPPIPVVPNLNILADAQVDGITEALAQTSAQSEVVNLVLQEVKEENTSWEQVLQSQLKQHQIDKQLLEQRAEQLIQQENLWLQQQQQLKKATEQCIVRTHSLDEREQALQQKERLLKEQEQALNHTAKEEKQEIENLIKKEKAILAQEKESIIQARQEIHLKQTELNKKEQVLNEASIALQKEKEEFTQSRIRQEQNFQQQLSAQSARQREAYEREQSALQEFKHTLETKEHELKANTQQLENEKVKLNDIVQKLKQEKETIIATKKALESNQQLHQQKLEQERVQLKQREQEIEQSFKTLELRQNELQRQAQTLMSEKQSLEIQISLYQQRISHLDLKPQNFVITIQGMVYVIDFGCSRYFKEDEPCLIADGGMGDLRYYSPERYAHFRYLHQLNGKIFKVNEAVASYDANLADSWAMGVMLLELLLQRHPLPWGNFNADMRLDQWDSHFMKNEIDKHFASERFKQFETLDKEFCALIRGLLQIKPTERLAIANVWKNFSEPVFNEDECAKKFAWLKIQQAPEKRNHYAISPNNNALPVTPAVFNSGLTQSKATLFQGAPATTVNPVPLSSRAKARDLEAQLNSH